QDAVRSARMHERAADGPDLRRSEIRDGGLRVVDCECDRVHAFAELVERAGDGRARICRLDQLEKGAVAEIEEGLIRFERRGRLALGLDAQDFLVARDRLLQILNPHDDVIEPFECHLRLRLATGGGSIPREWWCRHSWERCAYCTSRRVTQTTSHAPAPVSLRESELRQCQPSSPRTSTSLPSR